MKMKTRRLSTLFASVATFALAGNALAQKTTDMGAGGGGSAHVKTEWTVAKANISITYGRPALKGRSEAKMMPVDSVWRVGADQPTIITSDKTLKFGTITLAPGSYTINTLIGDKGWTFLAGKLKTPPQWGIPYLKDQEIGRAPMTLTANAKPVELVTITIDPKSDGGTLNIEWGSKKASIPFTVAP